ncbi:hypothetical protein [Sphingomonas pituitosa]|uniref:hypothetical protein n=1 Tax=Sphingomonas pituitosa TaxID=99597 RepID=UPI000AD5F7D0|nr:hypothetical protein [Sphingomonas pituitosa]
MDDLPVSVLLKRVRRAARNGERLHLGPEHARALMDPRVYAVLCEIESEEFRAGWQVEGEAVQVPARPRPAKPSASSSGLSGFGIAATATTGTSVGSMDVSLGAHRRVSAVTAEIRRKKRNSPS